MKRIEIKLSRPVVAPLVDFLKPSFKELDSRLALDPRLPGEDPAFEETWRKDLLAVQSADAARFQTLFDREFEENGTIRVDEDGAGSILRAAASLRLFLRLGHLRDLPDEALEKGDLAFESLSPTAAQAYACYLFLATIQEIVIQHLEPAQGR